MERTISRNAKQEKKKIEVTILTNWSCNYACKFCFLGTKRTCKHHIDINILKEQIAHIRKHYQIVSFTLYGGEISLLGFSFLESIYRIIASIAPIYIITNLSDLDFCKKASCLSGVRIGTSLNKERDRYPETLQSLMQLDIPIDITSVVTPSLLTKDTKTLLKEYQYIGRNVSFIQYSKSQTNLFQYNISNKEYEDFIKKIIYAYESGSYTFYLDNIGLIKSALQKEYMPSMEKLIFITPENLFASIQYDDKNCEYFKTYSSLSDWQRDCRKEQTIYATHCKDCEYYKHCLAEHIRSWDPEDECCGMKGLLQFYENIH